MVNESVSTLAALGVPAEAIRTEAGRPAGVVSSIRLKPDSTCR